MFQLPETYEATAGETILAEQHNDPLEDLEQDANTPRPIVAGGTGVDTAIEAADAFSTKGANVASATTTDLSTATGRYVHITGTTTITGLGTATAGIVRILTFDGALTLTHNATSLILPGGANITTAAGDVAVMVSEGGGNWRCAAYRPATGLPIIGAGKGTAIASATTISIGSAGFYHITGTTTITDIDFTVPGDGRWAILEFDGALTLTHHATTLVLPGGASIGTAAGDTCMVVQDSGDNIHVVWYQRAASSPLIYAARAAMEGGTTAVQAVTPANQQYHPLMPKFLYAFNGTGTPAAIATAGVAVSSITDHGAGDWTLNLAASFTNALWFCFVTAQTNSSGQNDLIVTAFDKAAGSVRIHAFDQSAGALADCTRIDVMGFGTLA